MKITAPRIIIACVVVIMLLMALRAFSQTTNNFPTLPVKPQPKIVDTTCKVVTVANQVACKKVVVGTFANNPAWVKALTK